MRLGNNIIAYIVTGIIVITAFLIFALDLTTISLPDDFEEYALSEVIDTIKVHRNEQGIPHITAKNEHDIFYSIGYIHAQDRLWQMDFMRRAASGELSEVFGKETVNIDLFMRALGLKKIANTIWKSINKKSKSIVIAYCDGINGYIKTHYNTLTFEFGTLDYMPKKWEPTDCLVIGRAMAFELSLSFWADIMFGEISEKIGVDKALDLIPSYPDDAPCIMDDTSLVKPPYDNIKHRNKNKSKNKNIAKIEKSYKLLKKTVDLICQVRNFMGIKGSSLGSNCWAIKKNKSQPSAAILANDPHLTLGIPSRWYQIHVSTPMINIIGLTIPGLPLFLSGRNNHIAWGITNIMLDDCDFFIEKTDSSGIKYYDLESDRYRKFIFVKDTIKIRNEENHVYYLRYTKKSAVISDAHYLRHPEKLIGYDKTISTPKFFDRYCLTFTWTAANPSDEISALYKINTARNWKEFLSGVKHWGSPGLNFTYADKKGNIGIAPAGMLPIRQENCKPNIPNPSWLLAYGWQRILPPRSFPRIYNPTKKYVVSANNKTSRNFDFFITSHWEPFSRAERIEELLNEFDNYSARDAQFMQMDVLSPYARKLLSYVIPIIEKHSELMNEEEKNIFQVLKNWDYIMSAGSAAASIYNTFFERLIYNTFHDELSDRLYREYVFISNIPTRRIMELISDGHSVWFDNVFTERKENRDYIIFKSFRDAAEKLTELFGNTSINTWNYGKIHTLTLRHVFSESKFLEPTVTLGPFEIGGNLTTINNTAWHIFKPFDVVIGASMRFIADMGDTVIYTSLPGGVSGDPASPYYSNQVQLWLNGGYVKMPISETPGDRFKLTGLLLPEEK